MRVFVYELVTGGGWWSLAGQPPSGSLLAEGRAMAQAVIADFRNLPADVATTIDSRLAGGACAPFAAAEVIASPAEEQRAIRRLAAAADWTLVIAPESDGALLARSRWAIEAGGRLLSPFPATIELASEKQRTAEHLTRHGVSVPRGVRFPSAEPLPADLFPAVLKPVDGCGSLGVRQVADSQELQGLALDRPHRLEQFVPGLAASVALLCGPGAIVPLPACEQHLSADGQFTYLGGRTPLPEELDQRARKLTLAAIKTLPDPLGYLGVDLVLGDAANGSGDRVIEINPRLTTSYVGLRKLCRQNLAAAMLEAASGRRPALSWRAGQVQFSSDGQIVSLPHA